MATRGPAPVDTGATPVVTRPVDRAPAPVPPGPGSTGQIPTVKKPAGPPEAAAPAVTPNAGLTVPPVSTPQGPPETVPPSVTPNAGIAVPPTPEPQGPPETAPNTVVPGPATGQSTSANVTPTVPVQELPVDTPNVDAGNNVIPNISYIQVLANGTVVVSRTTALNFAGSGVTVTGSNGAATITISGGSSYGNSNVVTLLSAFGSNTVSTTGNVTGGYILGNGSQLTGLPATYGNANVVANLAALGSNPVSTTGNITGGNVLTGGIISATGNIFGGNAVFTGNLSVAGNVTYINSNVVTINDLAINLANNAANISLINGGGIELGPQGTPYVTFLYNTSANTFTSNVGLSAVANITGGNVLTAGLISASGNVTGSYILGNGSQLTGIAASYGNANVAANLAAFGSNPISTTGNVTAGNLIGNISITGNVTGTSANVSLVAGSYTTTFDNTGNTTFANGTVSVTTLTASGNVTGNYILGNGSQLTGIAASYGNANVVANLAALGSNPVSTTGNVSAGYLFGNGSQLSGLPATYGNANVVANLAALGSNPVSTTGNITAGNLITSAAISAASVSASGNVTGGNVLTGGLVSAAANVTGGNVLTAGLISATGNITGGNLITSAAISAASVSASGNITASGNILGNNIVVNSTLDSGSTLFTLTGALVVGGGVAINKKLITRELTVWDETTTTPKNSIFNVVQTGSGYDNAYHNLKLKRSYDLSDAAAGNYTGGISFSWDRTSIERLTSEIKSKKSSGGGALEFYTSAGATSTLALTITDSQNISAVGNITAGNLNAAGLSLSSNVVSALNVTGAIAGANVTTPGLISATGNITGGNVLGGANVNATTHTGTTVSVSANVTGGNVLTGGLISATGNVTTANYFVGNLVGTSVSVTGNISATNVIVNGQPTTYGVANLTTGVVAVQATATGTLNTDYINAGRGTSSQTSAGAGSDIIFNSSIVSSGISLNTSTGVFTLTAGKTYKLFAELSFSTFSSVDNFIVYDWVDATTNTRLDTSGMSAGIGQSLNRDTNEFNATSTTLIYTPTTNQTVKVRIVDALGTVTIRADIGTKAIIEQIANTFALNALATMSLTGNITTTGNVLATGNVTGGNVLTGGVISSTGNITGGNISATNHTGTTVSVTGNITAANFFGNGNTLSNVATRFESAWTVPVGNSTQSFTVGGNETYQMWVDCNIPNGILVWNATATVTNTNVPVVGQQFAWVYNGGGLPIDFTSIPNQFVGTANTILRSNVAPSATTNRFDFGLNNTSGGNVTVRYGWVAIS